MKEKTAGIILAAGRGSRMKSEVQKQYLPLGGRPVLFYALQTFQDSFLDEIILVTGVGEGEYCRREIVEKYGFDKVSRITEGGAQRYHSVFSGLLALQACDYVFIHDGARPFVTREMLERALRVVRAEKACILGMPVKDTIKLADEQGFAAATPRRDRVWMVQTPQVFSFPLVRDAYAAFLEQEQDLLQAGIGMTDDAMVVEHFTDTRVRLLEGSYDNIKITTPEDMVIAERILEKRQR